MSLKIIKSGLFNTVQDGGRNGFRYLGINPNGPMDRYSAELANALLGKKLDTAVVEMHFPASTILFQEATIICITGADFHPTINGQAVPICEPIYVPSESVLEFKQPRQGVWCYVALLHDLNLELWLNSYSTNSKIVAGGYQGRPLKKNDVISFNDNILFKSSGAPERLNWHARQQNSYDGREICFLKGPEWNWLTNDAAHLLQTEHYQILQQSERMAYQLSGAHLATKKNQQLISSAVCAGTVQLLPTGQPIVLMADHQTTGGYPRVAQVITNDLPVLAQQRPGNLVRFKQIDLKSAEQKIIEQHNYLKQLQLACHYKMQNFLHAHLRS